MADHQEASVTLPSDPASVSAAEFVADVLAEWGLPCDAEVADTVRLIVSELRHQRRPTHFRAVASDHGGHPLTTNTCGSASPTAIRAFPNVYPPPSSRTSGSSMVIIRWLTAECGGRLVVRPTREGGKTVAIELPWTVPAQPVTAGGPQEP